MTQFICITFGPAEDSVRNGWYNRKERFETQRSAERCGRELLSVAGTFGYVVIEAGEDYWEVVDELGAPSNAVSITCDRLGTFSVQPAPQLTLV
jgi:hypothetical protein